MSAETKREAPARIYLQVGCDDPNCDHRDDWGHAATWCEDQIHASDVAYYREGLGRPANMNEAPPRLWIDTFGMEPGRPKWGYWDEPTESTTEYVRADIVEKQRNDLLAALRGTLSWLTSYPGHGADAAYEAARAAISKATGH